MTIHAPLRKTFTLLILSLCCFSSPEAVCSDESVQHIFIPVRKASEAEKDVFSKAFTEIKRLPKFEMKIGAAMNLLESQRFTDDEGWKEVADFIIELCPEIKDGEKKNKVVYHIATIHNARGDFAKAVELMRLIDEPEFREKSFCSILNQRSRIDFPRLYLLETPLDEEEAEKVPVKPSAISHEEFVTIMKKIIEEAVREKTDSLLYQAEVCLAYRMMLHGNKSEGTELFRKAMTSAKQLEKSETEDAMYIVICMYTSAVLQTDTAMNTVDLYETLDSGSLKDKALLGIFKACHIYDNLPLMEKYVKRTENKEILAKAFSFYFYLLSREGNEEFALRKIVQAAEGNVEISQRLTTEFIGLCLCHNDLKKAMKIIKIQTVFDEKTHSIMSSAICSVALRQRDFQIAAEASQGIRTESERVYVVRKVARHMFRHDDKVKAEKTLEKTFSEQDRKDIAIIDEWRKTVHVGDCDEVLRYAFVDVLARENEIGDVSGMQKTLTLVWETAIESKQEEKKIDLFNFIIVEFSKIGGIDEALKLFEKHEDALNTISQSASSENQLHYLLILLTLASESGDVKKVDAITAKIRTMMKSIEAPDATEFQRLVYATSQEGRVREITPESESYRILISWIEKGNTPEERLPPLMYLAGNLVASKPDLLE